MLNSSSFNKNQAASSGFQPANASYLDIKEEPSSPVDCDNQIACADADNEDVTNGKISKRRTAHTVAEQKRRDAIKKGYEDLQTIVPACLNDDSPGAPKISKAVILQKTIDYLGNLLAEKQEKEKELNALKEEVLALKIMKANYEQIAKSTQTQTSVLNSNAISDEVKFGVFKTIMDTQFLSFNDAIHITNFEALSASVFKWLEEECKPQKLQDIVLGALRNTNFNNG